MGERLVERIPDFVIAAWRRSLRSWPQHIAFEVNQDRSARAIRESADAERKYAVALERWADQIEQREHRHPESHMTTTHRFEVTITRVETASHEIVVEAASPKEAMQKAIDQAKASGWPGTLYTSLQHKACFPRRLD